MDSYSFIHSFLASQVEFGWILDMQNTHRKEQATHLFFLFVLPFFFGAMPSERICIGWSVFGRALEQNEAEQAIPSLLY